MHRVQVGRRSRHAWRAKWALATAAALLPIVMGASPAAAATSTNATAALQGTQLVLPYANEAARLAVKPKAPRTLKSKGYKGTTTMPAAKAPDPPTPAVVGRGAAPNMIVDAAGTAHIVWNEDHTDGTADVTHYCRLPRGATACANANQTPMPITGAFASDDAGPKIFQVNDTLVVITHRYPTIVKQPDGQERDRTTYMWTSVDGGDTWTGPGIVGDILPNTATLVGTGDDPRIAVLTDTFTGGARLQVLEPGKFHPDFLQLATGDTGVHSSIVPDGGGLLAAYQDIARGSTVLRSIGDYKNAGAATAQWATSRVAGDDPQLVNGARGPILLAKEGEQWTTRAVAGGNAGIASLPIPGAVGGAAALAQAADGSLYDGTILQTGDGQVLQTRSSTDGGVTWSSPFDLAKAGTLQDLTLAALPDGGGFAITRPDASTYDGPISLSAFGSLAPTGKLGAGSKAGGGIPGGFVGCLGAGFDDVAVEPKAGCLLQSTDPKFEGAVVSKSEIDLNGLVLIPDANVSILFNPKTRTLDTTGKVKVVLRLPVGGDVELVHAELHAKLGSKTGDSLFDGFKLPAGPDIKGFPIDADFDPKIDGDGVKIAVSLKLPKSLGGLSASATLTASRNKGASLQSFKASLGKIPLGPVELANLSVSYQGTTERWEGDLGLHLPLGDVAAHVTFEGGKFVNATIGIGFTKPGIPVFQGVWWTGASGQLGVDPFFVEAGASLGFFWNPGIEKFSAEIDGKLRLTVLQGGLQFQYDGDGKLYGVHIGHETLVMNTRPQAKFDADFGYNLAVVGLDGKLGGFVDGPTGTFGAQAKLDMKLLGVGVGGAQTAVSSKGIGGCIRISFLPVAGIFKPTWVGVGYTWNGSIPDDVRLIYDSDRCVLDDYTVNAPTGARARRLQAGGTQSVSLAGGVTGHLEVLGSGGAPDVDLIAPGGQRITPAVGRKPNGNEPWAAPLAEGQRTLITIPKAKGGTWQIEPRAGSVAITQVGVAKASAPTKVTGTVRRRGSAITFRYKASAAKGTTLTLIEQAPGGARRLGTLKRGAGTLTIPTGGGKAGQRKLWVVPTRGDLVLPQVAAGSYRAPGDVRLGAPKKVRISGTKVLWTRDAAAKQYVVTATLTDGRTIAATSKKASAKIVGATKTNRVESVTVVAVDRDGRASRTSRAKAKTKK